eukprot:scaffold776_cov347-Pavlova_lutheri.AAC.70
MGSEPGRKGIPDPTLAWIHPEAGSTKLGLANGHGRTDPSLMEGTVGSRMGTFQDPKGSGIDPVPVFPPNHGPVPCTVRLCHGQHNVIQEHPSRVPWCSRSDTPLREGKGGRFIGGRRTATPDGSPGGN